VIAVATTLVMSTVARISGVGDRRARAEARAYVQTAASSHTVTKAMVDRWMTELSNWGRWGKDDQRGTLNLLTPERTKKGLAAARDGVSVSLSHTYIEERAADATSPFGHEMLPL